MTKLKNTKKGMAKKALSISLVAAMLATSNVPVWAAEDLFSDGSAAVEAPAVEEPAAEVDTFSAEMNAVTEEVNDDASMLSTVIEANDLTIDISVSKSATFSKDEVVVSGSILKKDGTALNNYKYAWRVAGESTNIYTREITDSDVTKMGFSPDFKTTGEVDWDKYVGKTLELYIFKNEDSSDATKIDPIKIGSTVINKCDMTGTVLKLNKSKITYNGKAYHYTDTEDVNANSVSISKDGEAFTNIKGDLAPGTGSWNKDNILKYFNVSASGTALNAGEKLVITATAKEDSPYSGTIYATELEVKPLDCQNLADNFVLTVKDGLSYSYTGIHQIVLPNDTVTLKEKDTLSGADLSSFVKKVETVSGTIGTTSVKITLDTDKMKNFENVPETITSVDPELVTITKRDLKDDCVVTVNNGKVPYGTELKNLAKCFTFKSKDGTRLTLTNNLEAAKGVNPDYNIKVVNKRTGNEVQTILNTTDTYTVTITAYENPSDSSGTCVNGQSFDIEVADDVLTKVEYNAAYKPVYTGTEIKPSNNDLGSLDLDGSSGKETISVDSYKIIGYKNNINAATYENGVQKTWAYVTVEILAGKYKGETYDMPLTILPLQVTTETVTVPESVSYNKGYGPASDYNVPLIVTAKDTVSKTVVKGLSADDYTVKYIYKADNTDETDTETGKNDLHNYIRAVITITNPNFMGENGNDKLIKMPKTKYTEIVAKALTDSMITMTPSSYTYTGGNITPEFFVKDGALVLYEGKQGDGTGEYEVESITNNLNVGTGKVTIKGINDLYSGKASATFTITPANTSDVKVTIDKQKYTGKVIRPREFKATLNGNIVTDQFEIVGYGENIKAGKGTVILKPVDGNKNFSGGNITAEFDIIAEEVTGNLSVYNQNGENVTENYKCSVDMEEKQYTSWPKTSFAFDGNEKTFTTELLSNIQKVGSGKTTATKDDFEIKYVDNISGNRFSEGPNVNYDNSTAVGNGNQTANIGFVYAVAKEGSGFAGTKTIVTADGTVIKGVVDYIPFVIDSVVFVKQNVTITNATYAGGLPVKPSVLVQIGGTTLVEGKDYKLTLTDSKGNNITAIDVTDGAIYEAKVTGINGYAGSEVSGLKWGVDKKNISDCDVAVTNGVLTVMNGYIPVPVTEYTSKNNGDGTYTVTANTDSKNYIGSKTVKAEGQAEDEKPDAPAIQSVIVNGNNAKVVLASESEGATGYDYVISKDRDCINNKAYDKVNKNILGTETTFTYTQQGVYYAYCHAWKRVDGEKVFSDWSAAYPFVVSSITPEQPSITKVEKSSNGKHLRITWTKSANAIGYDVVMGTKLQKVNGEYRPVEYGKAVKKVTNGNTVSVIFYNIPKGTYYVGLHAYNRSSESGVKVFSQWSNSKKVTF